MADADSIFDAAWRGDLANVVAFIAAGVSPSARNIHLLGVVETPLLLAADNGHTHVIDFLIQQHRVDPNEKDGDGKNALHYSVYARGRELIAHLLRHHAGCDPNSHEREEGHTPLTAACQYGPPDLVRALLDDLRVDLELPRLHVSRSGALKGVDEGATALWLAAKAGQWETVGLLVARGADPMVAGPRSRPVRTVLEMVRRASPGPCPATVRDLVTATVADVERAQALHRLRSLNDAAEATQARMAAVVARSGTEGQQRQTRSKAVAQMLDKVPPYLRQRMRQRRRPLPRVEMVTAKVASKKRATGAQEAGHAEDPEERLRAVAAHVVLGGMVQAHVAELLEMLAPKCLHLKEARRRAEAEAGAAAAEDV